MRETNMRKLNRLIQTFHQSWSEKMPASLQLSTKNGEVSNKIGTSTTSSQVSLPQATLLVQRTAVGLAVIEGGLRKSGQHRGQLCFSLPVHLSPNVSTSGRIFGRAKVGHTTMGTLSGL